MMEQVLYTHKQRLFGYTGISLTVHPSIQVQRNRWTNTDDTLHSCSIRPDDVQEDNIGPNNFKGEN